MPHAYQHGIPVMQHALARRHRAQAPVRPGKRDDLDVVRLLQLGYRNGFSGSVLEEGKYLISGALRSAVDKEPYDALFTVKQGHLAGGLITRHGCWDLTGIRTEPAALRLENES